MRWKRNEINLRSHETPLCIKTFHYSVERQTSAISLFLLNRVTHEIMHVRRQLFIIGVTVIRLFMELWDYEIGFSASLFRRPSKMGAKINWLDINLILLSVGQARRLSHAIKTKQKFSRFLETLGNFENLLFRM